MLTLHGKEPPLSRSAILTSWDKHFGGNPSRRLRVTLRGYQVAGSPVSAHICRGKGVLQIVEHRTGSQELGETPQRGLVKLRVAAAP